MLRITRHSDFDAAAAAFKEEDLGATISDGISCLSLRWDASWEPLMQEAQARVFLFVTACSSPRVAALKDGQSTALYPDEEQWLKEEYALAQSDGFGQANERRRRQGGRGFGRP
jgi:hypothetical protein